MLSTRGHQKPVSRCEQVYVLCNLILNIQKYRFSDKTQCWHLWWQYSSQLFAERCIDRWWLSHVSCLFVVTSLICPDFGTGSETANILTLPKPLLNIITHIHPQLNTSSGFYPPIYRLWVSMILCGAPSPKVFRRWRGRLWITSNIASM